MNKEYKRPQIKIECSNCGDKFEKDGSEVRRNKKLGRRNYCSYSCANKNKVKNPDGNPENLIAGNRRDKYTPIREHLRRVRKRCDDYNITLDDLLNQWEAQNGICPYTGVNLIPPIDCDAGNLINKASLDRIDSTKSYVKGNIQFISAAANMAKNNMTHDEMVSLCKTITKFWSNKNN